MSTDLGTFLRGRRFATILADPPWQFDNRTGKVAPEHKRLARYETMTLDDICAMPVQAAAADTAHLYLWVPNALLPDGLRVMDAWGFKYKANIVWHKIRKDGGSDGRGVGFYFRNVTEILLFGVRGKNARTLAPGRRQVNLISSQKREHSRKPDEIYPVIEACSPGPRLELFARGAAPGWVAWGNEAGLSVPPPQAPLPAPAKLEVVVHSKGGCPWCERAKAWLGEAGIPFEEARHDDDADRGALYDRLGLVDGARTVPQIILREGEEDHRIGGYSDLIVSGITSLFPAEATA